VGHLDREFGELGPRSDAAAAPHEHNVESRAEPQDEVFGAALGAVRSGSNTALGAVFEECRNYLLLVANQELGPSIQAKVGAADLVQETLLQAQMILDGFEATQGEFLAQENPRVQDGPANAGVRSDRNAERHARAADRADRKRSRCRRATAEG
jgi:hypothetical protein